MNITNIHLKKGRNGIRRLAASVLGLVVLAVAGGWLADYGHARWVARCHAAWEAEIERDADGIRPGFTAWQQGEGEVALLFVHGFAGAPSLFTPWGTYFADRGYTCVAIRLPGFGEPLEQAAQITVDDWVQAVHTAARELHADHEQVWIVAHSLGATLAVQLAAHQPEWVDGLILFAPLFKISSARSPWLSPPRWYRWGRRVTRHTTFIESALPVDAHDPQLADQIQRDRYIPWAIYDALFQVLAAIPLATDLGDTPVWIALAADDEIIDNAAVHDWFDPIAQPPNVLVEQSPAGHVLPRDTGWQRLREKVDIFLNQ